MKNLFKTLLLLVIITHSTLGQINIKPRTLGENANVSSNDENRMSIGTDGNTLNFLPLNSSPTRNVGIGTSFSGPFAVAPSFINEGKLHIKHNSSTSNIGNNQGPQLILDENESGDFARLRFRQSYITTTYLPFYSVTHNRGARYWDIAGFANGSSTVDDKLNFQNNGINILTLRGDGNVGILNDNPTLPFHVNTSVVSSNSQTGTASIGPLSGQHIIFDNNRINSYNSTYGAGLTLNDISMGDVRIGTPTFKADLRVSGYTSLGDGTAPNIKMKKLTGTTSNGTGGFVDIPHGIINASKILAVDIHVNYSGNSWVEPNYTFDASTINFVYTYDNNNITVKNSSTYGAGILSKPITILVTYQE